MKVFIDLLTILLFPLLISADVSSYFDVGYGKCDGMFSAEIGTVKLNTFSSQFIKEISTKSKEKCRWICSREIKDCWMIEYLDSSCRLYKSIVFDLKGTDSLEFWKCAKPNCNKFTDRCFGYFVGYDNYTVNSEAYFPISVYYNITFTDCLNYCISHSMCGLITGIINSDINIFTKCTLLYGYLPFLEDNYTSTFDSHSVSIRCCDKDDYYLKSISDKRETQNDETILIGEWRMINKDKYNLSSFDNVLYIQFPIMHFEICVKECSKNPFCQISIFIADFTPICVMILDSKIGNFQMDSDLLTIMNKSRYYIWEWNTFSTQSKFRVILNDNSSCFCLSKCRQIQIKGEACSNYNVLEINGTLNLYMEKSLKSNNTFFMNDGYRNFEVLIENNKDIEYCDKYNCKIYSELSNSRDPLIFVKRKEWFPVTPLKRDSLTLPVEMVVILNTYKPDGRCFSKTCCSAFVRDFQIFHLNVSKFSDIAYNFLIGEDGRIYHARGWKYSGAHTKGFNSRSIGVAFIGWFENVSPSTKALVGLRNLIKYGIENKFIQSNFLLSTNRVIRSSDNPGIKLSDIISSWELMDLSKIENCSYNMSILMNPIYFIGMAGFIFCTVIISIPIYLNRIHRIKSCQFVKRNLTDSDMKIGWYFDNNYEMKMEKVDLKVDQIYFCDENENQENNICQCIVNFKALFWYCLINTDVNFMYKFSTLQRNLNCVKLIHLYSVKSKLLCGPKVFIFFHMNKRKQEKRQRFFLKMISGSLCICKRFTVYRFPQISYENLHGFLPKLPDSILNESDKNFDSPITLLTAVSLKKF